MSKKGSKKKKKSRKKPDIPIVLKGNLSDAMREEREAETFENINGAAQSTSTSSLRGSPSDVLVPTTGYLSECSTQKSTGGAHTRLQPAFDETLHYLNDIVSVYEGTCGTVSFESLMTAAGDESGAEELRQEENKLQQLKTVPLRKVIVKANEMVGEMEFTRGTTVGGQLLPGVTEEIRWGKGESEMDFVQRLVNDVNTLVAISGRIDVLLQYSIQFERNHLPILRISLGKKSSSDKNGSEEQREILAELEREEKLLERPPPAEVKHEPIVMSDVLELVNAGFELANALPV